MVFNYIFTFHHIYELFSYSFIPPFKLLLITELAQSFSVYVRDLCYLSNALFITEVIQVTWMLVPLFSVVSFSTLFSSCENENNNIDVRVMWELFKIIYVKSSSTFHFPGTVLCHEDTWRSHFCGLNSTSVECFPVWFPNQWCFPGHCLCFLFLLPQELAQYTVNSKYSTEWIWVILYPCEVNKGAV